MKTTFGLLSAVVIVVAVGGAALHALDPMKFEAVLATVGIHLPAATPVAAAPAQAVPAAGAAPAQATATAATPAAPAVGKSASAIHDGAGSPSATKTN